MNHPLTLFMESWGGQEYLEFTFAEIMNSNDLFSGMQMVGQHIHFGTFISIYKLSVFYTEVTYLKLLPIKDYWTQDKDIPTQTGKHHLKIKNVSFSIGKWLCNTFICNYRRVRLGCIHVYWQQLLHKWSHRYFDAATLVVFVVYVCCCVVFFFSLEVSLGEMGEIWQIYYYWKSVRKSTNGNFITMGAVNPSQGKYHRASTTALTILSVVSDSYLDSISWIHAYF